MASEETWTPSDRCSRIISIFIWKSVFLGEVICTHFLTELSCLCGCRPQHSGFASWNQGTKNVAGFLKFHSKYTETHLYSTWKFCHICCSVNSLGFNSIFSFGWKEPYTQMGHLERTRMMTWSPLARTTPMSGPWEKNTHPPQQMPTAWPGCTTRTSMPLRISALD